jgi:hypothetical protein
MIHKLKMDAACSTYQICNKSIYSFGRKARDSKEDNIKTGHEIVQGTD